MIKQFMLKRVVWFVIAGTAALVFFGGIVMLLWNSILVPVLHVASLSFWQATGLLLLSKILFGGFRGGPWRGKQGRCGNGASWREDMRSRWAQLSPEEREQLQQRWKDKCRKWNRTPGQESGTE